MEKIEEFWYCVSPQEELPLYKGQVIGEEPCANLVRLVENCRSRTGTPMREIIRESILARPAAISDLRVLVGVSDKRLYLDLTYLANRYQDSAGRRIVKESRAGLKKHDTDFFIRKLSQSPMRDALAEEITAYFMAHGLEEIMQTFLALKHAQIVSIFNNLIAPKEIQQMQAKYRGHGAEQAFARTVKACGLDYLPEGKAEDPMAGRDPNVNLSAMEVVPHDAANENCHSFDLVIKDCRGRISVLVQSLIHSSDPGQYGVNKAEETMNVAKRIREYNMQHPAHQVYLFGSVDGVGFCENPTGTILRLLDAFDGFAQVQTLFKIPLFLQSIGEIDNIQGIAFDKDFFGPEAIAHFQEQYLKPAKVEDMSDEELPEHGCVKAGKATVIFRD